MASLRGNLFRMVLRRTTNLNPVRTPDAVAKLRGMAKGGSPDRVPKGFVLSRETTPDGVPYERISKKDAPKTGRVVYYLHGGAYICGLLPLYRDLAPGLYQATGGCEVIFLDYRCAPEYKYPCQLEDAWNLWEDLTGRQGYREKNMLIAGDSAGANLALALMLKLRDQGKPMPRCAFCISAWADMTGSGDSYIYNYGNDIMFGEKGKEPSIESKQRLLESEIFCFVGDADRTDPYVSPVYGDYSGFPPMFFTAGGHEMLLSDTLTIMEKLKQNGVPVDCDIQDKMFHIHTMYGRHMPEGAKSYRRIMQFIEARFQA